MIIRSCCHAFSFSMQEIPTPFCECELVKSNANNQDNLRWSFALLLATAFSDKPFEKPERQAIVVIVELCGNEMYTKSNGT